VFRAKRLEVLYAHGRIFGGIWRHGEFVPSAMMPREDYVAVRRINTRAIKGYRSAYSMCRHIIKHARKINFSPLTRFDVKEAIRSERFELNFIWNDAFAQLAEDVRPSNQVYDVMFGPMKVPVSPSV